jgi:hypothetical protein
MVEMAATQDAGPMFGRSCDATRGQKQQQQQQFKPTALHKASARITRNGIDH